MTTAAVPLGRTNPHSAPAAGPIIEVRNLARSFVVGSARQTVFEGLSYTITQGSFVSVVGPSGCGKSTLLKLISGLDMPTAGDVLFNGTAVSGPAKGMIYVFQQYAKSILPWRTVIENVEFGLNSYKKLGRKQARERCREYIGLVGLEGYENYHPYQLSGGMQQRVCIARALICEPGVLLMDEPFSAVDAMTRAGLQELILEIWQTLPVTILFVTHDVEEAVFLSTHIISLSPPPATIQDSIVVDLPYPRDPVETRGAERFIAIRQRLFASIFTHEKLIHRRTALAAAAPSRHDGQ